MRNLHGIPVVLIACLGLIAAAGTPLPGQTVNVDEPDVCLECHSELSSQLQSTQAHAAFKSGQCSQCHNPHASKHATLLAADQKALCLNCHEKLGNELSLPVTHPPARNGECVSCHDAHSSPHASLLHEELSAQCQECHPRAGEWSQRPVVHPPVDDGECLTCHTAHGSEHAGLTSSGTPALCLDCHDEDQAFNRAHGGRPVGDSDCMACHDPHAADLKGLLHANQHAPFAGGDCQTCHGSDQGRTSFAMTGNTNDLCQRCHRGVQASLESTYHGHLDNQNACLNCHNPHASDAKALLAAEPAEVCMRCHFNEPGRKEKSHYVTHDGMDCTECHLPHGADNPQYFAYDPVKICARCHEAAHLASHPVGPEVVDARTGESVTCLSCHKLHGADFDFYLPLSPDMDLCIQCHKR